MVYAWAIWVINSAALVAADRAYGSGRIERGAAFALADAAALLLTAWSPDSSADN
jgi:hypothetical protein